MNASRMKALGLVALFVSSITVSNMAAAAGKHDHEVYADRFVQVQANTPEQRTELSELGMSIEFIVSDASWGFVATDMLKAIKKKGYKVLSNQDRSVARGGHGTLDFPGADERFHNYAEMEAALKGLANLNADIAKVSSIGKTLEGRDIWAIHINTTPEALMESRSTKPGIVYMGNHHAREHVSAEIPLMFADHLLSNRADPTIAALLDSRDIWIIPMVNPDGVEFDIATGRYRSWRKNRRDNGGGVFGVDLNRNYSFKWGTGGSSTSPSSDVYMGKEPFSEPETQVIRDFVVSQPNLKILLSFHTFSELILYPWGNTYDDIGNARDLATFKKMAETMAQWNRYTPQQASDLYIASGDTTDWAYGERGIFAFTFELSPKSMFNGGFYPGAGVLDRVFSDNLKPALYLLDLADNPYKAVEGGSGFLMNYRASGVDTAQFWNGY